MNTQLKEKQIEKMIDRVVVKRLRQALADPDFGLAVRPAFLARLKKSMASRKAKGLKRLKRVASGNFFSAAVL